jgi:acyl transferase domain-containing protein/acyl carrier protein
VILEEAPVEEAVAAAENSVPVVSGVDAWLVSGRSAEALAGQAGRLREWMTAYPEVAPADVAWSLATTRAVFEHRAVVFGGDRDALAQVATGQDSNSVVSGVARAGVRVGLIFAGQGSQWAGMGRRLYETSPIFAEVLDQVCGLLELDLGVSVRDLVLGAEGVDEALADQTLYAQTGLFAFEVALAAVLRAAGLTPDAVVGHSVGEISAAYVAGVLSLPEACRLVAARARAMQALPSGGAMAAINAAEAEVTAAMADRAGVTIAAINGPESVVVSGETAAVEQVVEHWRAQGRRVRSLRVSHAFHSAAMDPALAELGDIAAGLDHQRPKMLWAGALDGELVSDCDGGYWTAQTRHTVRFADALATLAGQGVSVFLEIGPDGSLSALGRDAVAGIGRDESLFIPMQRRNQADSGLLPGLARAFVHGVDVDWSALLPAAGRIDLPTYAFQHDRYWPEGVLAAPAANGAGLTAGTDAEAEFWATVENGDLAALAGTLDLPDHQAGELLPALASWRRRQQDRSLSAGWRYRVGWDPVTEPGSGALSGRWLVVTGATDDLTEACVRLLSDRGADVAVLETTETADQARLAGQIRATAPEGGFAGVVSLLALDETPLADHPALANGLAGTQTLIQALIALAASAPLWIVTRGAVAAVPGDVLTSPVQAQAWGIGRVSALEHPDHGGGLVDLPPYFDEQAADQLAIVLAGCGEDQVAIRPSGILGRRLVHAPLPGDSSEPWRPRGTVLITGGTGAIAGHVAHWLVDRGAPRLVLTSRSGPEAASAAALAAELASAGTRVEVFSCDAGDGAALAGAVARIGAGGPPLTAVMHAAGLGQNAALDETSVAELATVVTAKTAGAATLDRVTADLDLDAFVMFSSISATWGSGLQAGYAAANTFLDALAENRLVRGLPATSVAWGPWAGGGMTDVEDASAMQRRGVQLMPPEYAVQALAQVLDGREGLMTVVDVDWTRFAPPFTMRRPSPLIESLPEVIETLAAGDRNGPVNTEAGEALARQLAGLSPAEQDRLLTDLVRTHAAAVLGHASIETVEADRAFTDLGADSLTAVELRDRLTSATGLPLPSTLLFDYPTPAALAAYLRATQSDEVSPVKPVLAELEKLDGMLAAISGGDDSAQITNRLEVVLSKWKESQDRLATSDVADKLESSTDDEVFDFIEKELGIN